MQPSLQPSAQLNYVAPAAWQKTWFSSRLQRTMAAMARVLPSDTDLWIYPDATLKRNLLPTGVAAVCPQKSALLLPHLLRDPGCGYLLFDISLRDDMASEWYLEAGELLHEQLCCAPPPARFRSEFATLRELLVMGPEGQRIQHVFLTANENRCLEEDFMCLTNTLEINRAMGEGSDRAPMLGFLHSGSLQFPNLLLQRFEHAIMEYADHHRLATLADIEAGLFGVPYATELGQHFWHWLQAAMNYCTANRYFLWRWVKQILEAHFPCEVSYVQDTMHAGVWNHDGHIIMTRGVQRLTPITLVAGQRETCSALVTPGDHASQYQQLIGHGTSYAMHGKSHFVTAEHNDNAQQCYYNTEPELHACNDLTANLLAHLTHYQNIQLIKNYRLYAPLINIQSALLAS